MRISDWSSDVCSSDLPGNSSGTQAAFPIIGKPLAARPPPLQFRKLPACHALRAYCPQFWHVSRIASKNPLTAAPASRSEERRGGKGVSVRLDPGCRRILKKKKNKNRH